MVKLKIAYSPQSPNLSHPADRRRVVYWANRRGHELTTDINQKADVLMLSGRADFTFWTRKRVRPPLIIDLVDGYLGAEDFWRDWVRGTGKVLSRNISGFPRPYREILSEACSLADAVVCETIEQKNTILPFCENVHSILDFHEEFPTLPISRKIAPGNHHNLMWEGLPFTAKGLLLLENSFKELIESQQFSLEMVTDLTYPLFLGKYLSRDTEKILGNIPEILGKGFRLTGWSLDTVVEVAKRSHLSLLPLDPTASLNPLKAENRLLMMWRLGLPALASPSLAYSRVMAATDLNDLCSSATEWCEKILQMLTSPELRANSVDRGQQYIRDTHSEKLLLESWDKLFESVL